MESLRYETQPDAPWYVFLYGNVPGLQLDWIWRPAAGPGPTPLHVQHLHFLIQRFDVVDPTASSLSFGNLSFGDTRHMPGRGALAVMAHFRLPGSKDHSGRPNPPIVVALVSVDRALNPDTLAEAGSALLRLTDGGQPAGERPIDDLYARYLRAAERSPQAAAAVCQDYTDRFVGLPALERGRIGAAWVNLEGEPMPGLVELDNDVDPDRALYTMASIASVLYRTRARWSAISTTHPVQSATDQGTILVVAPDLRGPPISKLEREPDALVCQLLPLRPEGEEIQIRTLPEPDPIPVAPIVPTPRFHPSLPTDPRPELDTPLPDRAPDTLPPPPRLPPEPEPPFWRRWLVLFIASGALALILVVVAHLLSEPEPDPARPNPAHPEAPAAAVPSAPEPVVAEPSTPEPSTPEPVVAEPVVAEPVAPEPAAPVVATPKTPRNPPIHTPPTTPAPDLSQLATIVSTGGADCGVEGAGLPRRKALSAGMTLKPGDYALFCRTSPDVDPTPMSSFQLEAGRSYRLKCAGTQCRVKAD